MSAPPGPSPAESRRLLTAVFGATFFVRFGFGLTLSVFASYILAQTQGLSTTSVGVVGLVASASPIGEFSTVLFSGAAADRYGRFPVLLAGTAAAGILLALVSFTRDPLALAGLNLLFGVSSGAILAASLAVVADQADRNRTGYEMGRFDAMNLLGWIVGFAVGFGLLGALPNADLVWVFRAGAILLGVGVLIARQLSLGHVDPVLNRTFDLKAIYRALSRPSVLLVTLPWLVIYMLLGVGFVFLGGAAGGLGIPTYELAALIGGGGLILLATQPYFGRLADRYGRTRLMIAGTIGFVGVLVCAALLQQYGPQPALVGATVVSALVGIGYGPAALAALADLSQTLTRATTMAIYTLTIGVGMFLGLGIATSLYAAFGAAGLDAFFAVVGVTLVALTGLRWRQVRTGVLPVGA
ncbi:MAG: MFS transporter [Thermoplasmata archaeon]|nr:MFS transporter [Thermoplasmata archaeon]